MVRTEGIHRILFEGTLGNIPLQLGFLPWEYILSWPSANVDSYKLWCPSIYAIHEEEGGRQTEVSKFCSFGIWVAVGGLGRGLQLLPRLGRMAYSFGALSEREASGSSCFQLTEALATPPLAGPRPLLLVRCPWPLFPGLVMRACFLIAIVMPVSSCLKGVTSESTRLVSTSGGFHSGHVIR